MFTVIVGLLFTLVVSVGIVLLVALPHLRQGSRILTPDGERTVRQAQEQSREAARRLASLAAPGRRAGSPEASGQDGSTALPGVGRQRPAPVDSGPIPVEDGAATRDAEADGSALRPVQVIDVRDTPASPRAGRS